MIKTDTERKKEREDLKIVFFLSFLHVFEKILYFTHNTPKVISLKYKSVSQSRYSISATVSVSH